MMNTKATAQEIEERFDALKHAILSILLSQPKQEATIAPEGLSTPDKLWSIEEAARYLQVDDKTLRNRLAKQDDLNPLPVRCAGVQIRFKKDELDDWTLREANLRAAKKADTDERRHGMKAVEGR